jgi:hypothetical protein
LPFAHGKPIDPHGGGVFVTVGRSNEGLGEGGVVGPTDSLGLGRGEVVGGGVVWVGLGSGEGDWLGLGSGDGD